ncbi:hypothetical protein GUITHDRAFT_111965 [Guillardia theta CCMP2712]|uniref:YbaK/aminoacyl-tRNA synthetase-associated domain-containing protein n=1 Tax=Guillardia theta (strain CCMP2712) TaxID=905079 RepID=L1J0Q5_GUITC|nr:hypothetical protein GUITHDRAFT_111965 [Guillardia theta CCMP2712]EKX42113.1 hypothetical protein GUITHDRAFT_111965 [Guillardia theta CCMP2712]|eukprot:XP_005829093.1 hypothetical protein GUITHDRAFT_111965 [Guillardia theta CCMP2712]
MKVCGHAADEVLRRKQVKFEVRVQAEESRRCVDSAAERGVPLHKIIKSMVFVCQSRGDEQGSHNYLHCMVPGHCQVSRSKLEAHVGCECSLLDPDRMRSITGADIGAVHPFVPGVSRRILDQRVLANETISFNSGDMKVGLIVKTEDFLDAFEGEITCADIAYCEEDDYTPVAKVTIPYIRNKPV